MLFAFIIVQSVMLAVSLAIILFQAWKLDRLMKINNVMSAYAEDCVEWVEKHRPNDRDHNIILRLKEAVGINARTIDKFDVNDISGWFSQPVDRAT